MNFAAPLMLLGLLSIAIPVYLHLTRKQDHDEHPFPSLMFLRRLPFKEKQQRTLRDKGLLSLRCIAAALACLAFASPFFSTIGNESDDVSPHDSVLLIDVSYSMKVADRFSKAVEAAQQRIDGLGRDERLAIVAFDESARVIHELSSDRTRLAAALDTVDAGDLATDLSGAFDSATRLLARGRAARQSVVLISDMQATALAGSTHLRMPKDGELEVVRIESEVPANIAIISATINKRATDTGEAELQFVVKNTGDDNATDAKVFAKIDRRVQDLGSLNLEAGEQKTLKTPVVLASDRPVVIELGVSGDVFTTDNTRHLVGVNSRVVNLAILEPATNSGQQSRFLQAALDDNAANTRLSRIDADALNAQDVEFDALIVLDGRLDEASSNAIKEFGARGGGVLFVAATNTDRNFGKMHSVQTPSPAAISSRITSVAPDHPLSMKQAFAAGGSLSNVSVMTWRDIPDSDDLRTILALGDNTALLAERVNAAGRELYLTTNMNPAWSTLALEPGFVVLTRQIVDYLANRTPPQLAVDTDVPVDMASYLGSLPGGGVWRTLLASATATVEAPGGIESDIGPSNTVYVPRLPGIHEVHATGQSAPSLPIAVNVRQGESEFEPVNVEDLRQRLVHDSIRPDTIDNEARSDTSRDRSLAWYLLAIAGLLFVLESIVGNRLTHSRRQAAVAN